MTCLGLYVCVCSLRLSANVGHHLSLLKLVRRLVRGGSAQPLKRPVLGHPSSDSLPLCSITTIEQHSPTPEDHRGCHYVYFVCVSARVDLDTRLLLSHFNHTQALRLLSLVIFTSNRDPGLSRRRAFACCPGGPHVQYTSTESSEALHRSSCLPHLLSSCPLKEPFFFPSVTTSVAFIPHHFI